MRIGIGAVIFLINQIIESLIYLILHFSVVQNNGRSVYRLVEVCDVLETAKVYNLGNVKTNIGLR